MISHFEVLLVTLGLAVVIVSILRRIHLPPLLGYIIAGALVGTHGLDFLASKDEIQDIAEFGVVFLMFSIGLELSLPKLVSMRRSVLGLGGLQVLFCSLAALLVAKVAGLSWAASIVISGALALSSTAVVTKQLVEQDELHQSHGKLALAILLFQDLAAVPFLIIVPALANTVQQSSLGEVLLNRVLIGTLIFLVMLAAGRWLLRPLFHHIAQARSSELFMLTTLLVVLASAFLTEHYGLSAALGAFLAGVMLAETEYVHQIESDIQPFRDILLGLFFISVGLVFDPRVVMAEWIWVGSIVTALIVFKTLLIALLARAAGTLATRALRTGLVLAQGGEFGLFLLALALDKKVIDVNASQIVIAAIIISMAISPLLIRNSEKIALWLLNCIGKTPTLEKNNEDNVANIKASDNQVIICGFGRVGQTLAKFLEYDGIPYAGLDIDPVCLREARAASEPVFFGDPTQEGVLEAMKIDKARMLIVAFSNPNSKESLKILRNARRLNKSIPILVRTLDDTDLEALQIAGATEVIPDKLESSLMLASHMLVLLGQSPLKAYKKIKEVKATRYRLLRSYFEGEKLGSLEATPPQKRSLHAVELTEGAYAVGRTLEELRTEIPRLSVSSFMRNGYKCLQIAPYIPLQPGDVLVLEGTIEEMYMYEEKLLQG